MQFSIFLVSIHYQNMCVEGSSLAYTYTFRPYPIFIHHLMIFEDLLH